MRRHKKDYTTVAYLLGIKTAASDATNRESAAGLGGGLATMVGTGIGQAGLAAGGMGLESALTTTKEKKRLAKLLRKHMELPKDVSVRTDLPSNLQSHYHPFLNEIRTGKKPIPSVLAHEMGHASGKPFVPFGASIPLGRLGSLLSIPALLGQAYTDPESTTTKALQYGPGALQVPMLLEEGRASARALRGLYRAAGAKTALKGLLSLLPAYATYVGSATLPLFGGKVVQHLANPDDTKE